MHHLIEYLKNTLFCFVPKLRQFAARCGLLKLLESKSTNHIFLYLRSLFSIGDCEDLIKIGATRLRFSATKRIEKILKRNGTQARVFEYGSGASTVWFANKAKYLVSVEHDQGIFNLMLKYLKTGENLKLIYAPPEARTDQDKCFSQRYGFEEVAFDAFVNSIHIDKSLYDLILIDGRSRENCLLAAVSHLEKGGVIVFDDAQRARYRVAIKALQGFETEWVWGIAPGNIFPGLTAFIRRAGDYT